MSSSLWSTGDGYLATIEIELDSFKTLDPDRISEGECCDDWPGGECDFIFYLHNCSSTFTKGYSCDSRIDRFYGPSNTDSFRFKDFMTPPAAVILIQDEPRELVINITVLDEDDGYTKEDFVANYLVRFTPSMISTASPLPGPEPHVITIPGHSSLSLFYRAYCNDLECQQNPLTAFDFNRRRNSNVFGSQIFQQRDQQSRLNNNNNNGRSSRGLGSSRRISVAAKQAADEGGLINTRWKPNIDGSTNNGGYGYGTNGGYDRSEFAERGPTKPTSFGQVLRNVGVDLTEPK